MISSTVFLSFITLILLVWIAILNRKINKVKDCVEDEKDKREELEVHLNEIISESFTQHPP